ncbi:gamma carbonic anhydrase family protein [Peptostreptococcus faecalis]|uniref:gamma carbonic anhydrase family protein n=1 Tax=Peptostreptococcus faecalis TaxID=2045015 RepID=UPI000C7D6B73|nr:gamma carbonic anhydrase family protein [Peptostreptococcus faecalis]
MIKKYLDKSPKIPSSCYVDEMASVIGEVELGENVSIWPSASVRADEMKIKIGNNSNIQDCSSLHGDEDISIGENVSVGHGAIVHGAEIGNNVVVGMGSIILDGAKIGDNCIIGAGSLITGNKKFESGMMILGSPAKAVRKLTDEEIKYIEDNSKTYLELKKDYLNK